MRYTVTVEHAIRGQLVYTDVKDWDMNSDETVLFLYRSTDQQTGLRTIMIPLKNDLISVEILTVATDS